MRKSALFLLLLLLGAAPSFAQMEDRGGPGDFGTPPGADSDPFGTPPPTSSPEFDDRGGLDPCPPGTIPPGDRGGLGEPGIEEGIPGDRQLEQRELPPPGTVPPSPPGSVPPGATPPPTSSPEFDDRGGLDPCPPGTIPPGDRGGLGEPGIEEGIPGDRQLEQRELPPPGTVPPSPPGGVPPQPEGSIPPQPDGSVPGNQGGGFDQPGMGGQDQRGLDDRSGQDVPGSEQQTPPPLLPPSGGLQ